MLFFYLHCCDATIVLGLLFFFPRLSVLELIAIQNITALDGVPLCVLVLLFYFFFEYDSLPGKFRR